jgi:hypothetical protein
LISLVVALISQKKNQSHQRSLMGESEQSKKDMQLLRTALLLLPLAALLEAARGRKGKNYLPPSPPGLPFLGNLLLWMA